MDIPIRYGDTCVSLQIPEKNLAAYVKPSPPQTTSDTTAVFEEAFERSRTSLEHASSGKDVCVLVADATRDQPHIPAVSAAARRLRGAASVRFLITTGSHDSRSPDNLRLLGEIEAAASAAGLQGADVILHDCREAEFRDLGATSRGTPILANSLAVGAGLYVVLSDMKFHYFAGYSNAVKHFLPGVCAFGTIEANHSFALHEKAVFGRHPLHPEPSRRDNPLAADMLEGTRIITSGTPVLVLSTVASSREIAWCAFGPLEEVVTEGIRFIDENMAFTLPRFDHVVVGCGGFPNDESLYTAQRGLELTRNAFATGADILFVAECRNGIAPNDAARANFYDPLTGSLEEALQTISGNYRLYSHKAYRFAKVMLSSKALRLYSSLPEEEVEAARLVPVSDPQSVIDGWLRENPDARIAVFEQANKLAILPETPPLRG